LGGGGDDGIGLLRVDEVVELGLALLVVPGDTHHVALVAGRQVRIRVHQRLPHPLGVLDVLAEHDGLGVAVRGLQELGDLGGHHGGTLLQDQVPVEVTFVVFPVLDLLPILVRLALLGAPAFQVLVQADAYDLVRGQEAIEDALLRIPVMADTDSGDGGHHRSVATQAG